jgi:hypothetical protein
MEAIATTASALVTRYWVPLRSLAHEISPIYAS